MLSFLPGAAETLEAAVLLVCMEGAEPGGTPRVEGVGILDSQMMA